MSRLLIAVRALLVLLSLERLESRGPLCYMNAPALGTECQAMAARDLWRHSCLVCTTHHLACTALVQYVLHGLQRCVRDAATAVCMLASVYGAGSRARHAGWYGLPGHVSVGSSLQHKSEHVRHGGCQLALLKAAWQILAADTSLAGLLHALRQAGGLQRSTASTCCCCCLALSPAALRHFVVHIHQQGLV